MKIILKNFSVACFTSSAMHESHARLIGNLIPDTQFLLLTVM